jgi:hypothetical protein
MRTLHTIGPAAAGQAGAGCAAGAGAYVQVRGRWGRSTEPSMSHTPAWRAFKRTEDCACAVACLIYLAATLHAWGVLHVDPSIKLMGIVAAPLLFLVLSLGLPLLIPPVRSYLARYVWASFKAGFGQTPASVLSGLGLLALAAVFIYLQVRGASPDKPYWAGVFSAYGAGIGILFAQALMVRALERLPEVKAVIEERGSGHRP